MKKLKVMVSHLEIRDASLVLGQSVQAVKLSLEQAMNFRDRFKSFEEMRDFYGSDKVLKEGEQYDGYIAVRNSFCAEVVAMNGVLEKRNDAHLWQSNPDMKTAIEKGFAYFCTYYHEKGRCAGKFRYVWTFGDCRFDDWANKLRKLGYLNGEDPKELSETLKEKLIKGAINDEICELTESEHHVLKTYLGTYYKDFFIEF